MKLVFLSLETSKENWFSEVTDLYTKKIAHYVSVEVLRIKSKSQGRDAQDRKKIEEAQQILAKIESSDFVIVCDEKGKSLDSKTFAKKMISSMESGKKRVIIVIGGAYGVDSSVLKRADWIWSLSPMTMNHFVAHTVAMEQVYRALTIWKGVPYHNE